MERVMTGLLRRLALIGVVLAAVVSLIRSMGPDSTPVLLVAALVYLASRWGLVKTDRRLLLALGLAGFMLAVTGFGPLVVVLFPVGVYLLLRYITFPLSRLIAHGDLSIRWKFELGITVIAVMFMLVSLVNFQAMDYMHMRLHDIMDVGETSPATALAMVDELESMHHGPFFALTPILSLLGVALAATLGTALAWSVIDPVRRMEDGMRRMGAGDFTEPVRVINRDELGELAEGINQSADDIKRLHEAVVAEERNRALLERMSQVAKAQEEERRRIAAELHDGLGPSLAGLGNRLRACKRLIQEDPEAALLEVDEVVAYLKGHIQEIRNLSYDLRPVALEELGLIGAIRQRLEWFESGTGIRTGYSGPETVMLDPLAEMTVFRIVQESLNNIQKHADAGQVDVQVREAGGEMEVRVRDDGKGFDRKKAASAKGQGMGLRNMEDRAASIGASVNILSRAGSGCEVVLSIPLQEVPVGAGAHPSPVG